MISLNSTMADTIKTNSMKYKILIDNCCELGAIITYGFIALGAIAYGAYGLVIICGLGLFFSLYNFHRYTKK